MSLDAAKTAFWKFPYKVTCFVGAGLLGSLLWEGVTRDTSLISGLIFIPCFFVSVVGSLLLGLVYRTKKEVIRILINALIIVLIIPTLSLAEFLNREYFLRQLPRFQALTDLLVQQKEKPWQTTDFAKSYPIPDNYSDLPILFNKGSVHFDPDHAVEVEYYTRDTHIFADQGYVYRSDDNLDSLKKNHPGVYFRRLAPNWYYFCFD